MKQRFWLLILCALILTVIGVSAVQTGVILPQESGKTAAVSLFFVQTADSFNATALKSERRNIMADNIEAPDKVANAVVTALINGPKTNDLTAIIDWGTKVEWCVYTDGWLGISFNQNLSAAENSFDAKEVLARYSLVMSLASLELKNEEKISEVSIYVNGILQKPEGETTGIMTVGDIMENIAEKPVKYTAKLYFPSEGKLVEENRVVETRSNQSVEYYILQELLKGSQEKDKTNLFPTGTTIIKTNTEYGTCYVNVSKDFIAVFDRPDNEALLCIYSIVNSVTELDSVRAVKFLVEGQAVGTIGNYDLSGYFMRNIELIAQ